MRRTITIGFVAALLGMSPLQAVAAKPASAVERATEVLKKTGFRGEIAVGHGDDATGAAVGVERTGQAWPWASVTKQVVAVLVLQAVDKGSIGLDEPVSRYIPELGGNATMPTVRQLLQHRSGLRNPNDTPLDETEMPSFYTNGETGLAWCLQGRTTSPAEGWQYNNCDYIVLGEILSRSQGNVPQLFADRLAKPAGIMQARFAAADTAGDYYAADAAFDRQLVRFGAAGGLIGPLADMLRFDQALLSGKLLSAEARAELWRGDPALGFMGLGQWAFEAKIAGCPEPVRLIERRGAIGAYQLRNIILPDSGWSIALATKDGAFDFGEIWTGNGSMHDTLAAIACSSDAS